MLISVIIPTYKPQDYLWKCLDSLVAQTLAHDLFEVIVVLNGCSDPFTSFVADGLKNFEQLHVKFLHTEVPGVSNARNMGLDASDSQYVCFLDDDDWLSPTYLEMLLTKANERSIVASNVLACEEETMEIKPDYISTAYQANKAKIALTLFSGRRFMSSSCAKIIPRQVIGDGRFDTRFTHGEDALFMASVSPRVSTILLADEQCIYYRRLRTASVSRTKMPLSKNLSITSQLCGAYFSLWMRHFNWNNSSFFLSRIVATLMMMVKRL